LKLPEELSASKFFKYAVFLVYSFVIAQSFQVSTKVLIPFEKSKNVSLDQAVWTNACQSYGLIYYNQYWV